MASKNITRFRPRVEKLEERTLMAASVSLTNGLLAVTGTKGADVITLRQLNGRISVDGRPGSYPVGSGNSRVSWVYIQGLDGNDRITLTGGSTSARFTVSSTIDAGEGNDTVSAGDGGDIIYGVGGNDVLKGGAGNDSIEGDDGNDTLWGGANNDQLEGRAGNDVLHGEAGDDLLDRFSFDLTGRDELHGGADNDRMYYSGGGDLLDGGAGADDRVVFRLYAGQTAWVYSAGFAVAGTLQITTFAAGANFEAYELATHDTPSGSWGSGQWVEYGRPSASLYASLGNFQGPLYVNGVRHTAGRGSFDLAGDRLYRLDENGWTFLTAGIRSYAIDKVTGRAEAYDGSRLLEFGRTGTVPTRINEGVVSYGRGRDGYVYFRNQQSILFRIMPDVDTTRPLSTDVRDMKIDRRGDVYFLKPDGYLYQATLSGNRVVYKATHWSGSLGSFTDQTVTRIWLDGSNTLRFNVRKVEKLFWITYRTSDSEYYASNGVSYFVRNL